MNEPLHIRDAADFAIASDWPVHIDYTAIAVSFVGAQTYAADRVLPSVPVGSLEGRYTLYPIEDAFRIPETILGRDGLPNEYQPSGELKSFGIEGHGLLAYVPETDRITAGMPDPVAQAVRVVANMLSLRREQQVAALVGAAATYPAGSKETLAGDSQWSSRSTSDPVADIGEAASDMLVAPDRLLVSGSVWKHLRVHPKMVAAAYRNDAASGVLTREQAAAALDLDEVVVADARHATSNPGQAAKMGYIWGKVALLYRSGDAAMGMVDAPPALGYTPMLGGREVLTRHMPDRGVRGCTAVLVREARKELVTAARAGYLFSAAVS